MSRNHQKSENIGNSLKHSLGFSYSNKVSQKIKHLSGAFHPELTENFSCKTCFAVRKNIKIFLNIFWTTIKKRQKCFNFYLFLRNRTQLGKKIIYMILV